MALLEDISAYLAAQGIGVEATTLFIGRMPDKPDACTAIYQYPGSAPVKNMGIAPGGYVMEYPRINVRVRSATLSAGFAKIRAVFTALGGYSAGNILLMDALQSPFQLGPDENGREVFGCNFEATVRG